MLSGRHALVTDFGVAKAVSEATGREKLTTAGVALGTPSYMAPEQAAANPNIDHRADIYAVGALAYELLAGRPPFAGPTPQAILAAHVTEAPEPVTDHRAAVPPAMAQLVMKCLEKKPADRWQTTEELLIQLEGLTTTPSGGITPTDTRPIQITTRPRKKGIAIGAAGVAILAVLGGVLLRQSGTPLVDNRVMVAVFENETGDASLDAVGKIVADVLARGLQETRVVEIVDPRAALSTGSTTDGAGGVAAARALAQQLGAGTVVTGEYFRLGDSLRFQAQVMETGSGRILESLDPVAAAVENPMEGVELLNQRVMAAVATMYSPDMAGMATVLTLPTSYDAYREFITGMELISQNDWPTALRHFESGWSEDSTFAIAAIMAAFTHYLLGNPASADSIVSSLGDVRPRLMEGERHMMDWLEAILRGDNAAGYNAIRRASVLSTTDVGFQWVTGYTAIDINRPRDGLQFIKELDPQASLFSGVDWLWRELTGAHHMLGEHEEELEAARRGREQFPDRLDVFRYEAWALVALGRLDDVMRLMDEALAMPVLRTPGFGALTPAGVLTVTALALRAHGHEEQATALLDRAVAWYQARPGEWRGSLAQTFRSAGQWEEARELYRELAERSPAAYGNRGVLGIIAARLSEREEALRIDEYLAGIDRPYTFGGPTLWRARIAAVLGEQERAVNLLRDAFTRGTNYGIWLHRDPELASLRDYPPFQELLRPKG